MPRIRPLLRYPGGKYRAQAILSSLLPDPLPPGDICSPFLGGGSFELCLVAEGQRVVAMDKFFVLIQFWQQLLEAPQALAECIQGYKDRNIDSALFKALQGSLRDEEESLSTLEPLDTAARFFAVNRCSFSGATLSGGFSSSAASSRFTQSSIDRVRDFSAPTLSVEYADAHDVLNAPPEGTGFLFLDPPYLLEKDKNSLYGNKGHLHRGFDHKRFREQVEATGLPFLLTYNNDPEIHRLWGGYRIEEASWAYGMNTSKKSSEVIISNY